MLLIKQARLFLYGVTSHPQGHANPLGPTNDKLTSSPPSQATINTLHMYSRLLCPVLETNNQTLSLSMASKVCFIL